MLLAYSLIERQVVATIWGNMSWLSSWFNEAALFSGSSVNPWRTGMICEAE